MATDATMRGGSAGGWVSAIHAALMSMTPLPCWCAWKPGTRRAVLFRARYTPFAVVGTPDCFDALTSSPTTPAAYGAVAEVLQMNCLPGGMRLVHALFGS